MKEQTKTEIWQSLLEEARALSFLNEPYTTALPVTAAGITLDYSKQSMTKNILNLLLQLAESSSLDQKIQALLTGEKINLSENRPVLHTALRANSNQELWVDGKNVLREIQETQHRIKVLSSQIRAKKWLGYSGKPITDVVNIGIGGSDLGPRFSLQSLQAFISTDLGFHFISDVDPGSFHAATAKLMPETTLFIISSKSFTTKETLHNLHKAIAWIGQCHPQHFWAVTAHEERARLFGITTVLPIWDWVGGRYSFCSAMNVITALALGYEGFRELLDGAAEMDHHFCTASAAENLPILLALSGIWNNNFLNIHNLLFLIYARQLESFVPYVQQLDMESNGKSVTLQGNKVHYATGPIIWGGLGNQAQHSYYQLLCQGTHRVCIDFLTLQTYEDEIINQMSAAKRAVLSSGVHQHNNPIHDISGNIPFNHISINECTPFTIGALVALYEHKVFVQGVIWEINSFDQPGVESAKRHQGLEERAVSREETATI